MTTSEENLSFSTGFPSTLKTQSHELWHTLTESLLWSSYTTGLIPREWGQMGVTINDLRSGVRIAPPAEREYAVEPVGVETITPSDDILYTS